MKYFLYLLEHKWNVFKYCWKRGVYIHAFTHDLSKFYPDEFFAYARYFYGDYLSKGQCYRASPMCIISPKKYKEDIKMDFDKAWDKHKERNKHHWENEGYVKWMLIEISEVEYDVWRDIKKNDKYYKRVRVCNMPKKYMLQMICDLEAMAIKFNDSAKKYFDKKIAPEARFCQECLDFFEKEFEK